MANQKLYELLKGNNQDGFNNCGRIESSSISDSLFLEATPSQPHIPAPPTAPKPQRRLTHPNRVVRVPMAAIGSDKQAACGATEDPGCPVGSDRKGLTPEKVSLPSLTLTAPKQKSRLPHPNWVVRVPMAEIGADKLSLLPSPVRRSPSVMSAGERDYNFLGSCLGSRAMETPNKLKTYMGVPTPDKVSLPVLTPTAPKPKRRLPRPNRVVRMPMAAIGSDKQAACGATEDPGCPVGSDRKGLTPEKVSLPSLTAPKQKSRLPHPNWVVRVPMAEIGADKLSLLPSPVRRSPSVMSAGERDYNFLGSCLGSRAMETPNKLKTYMGVPTPDKVSLSVLTPTAPKPKRRLPRPNRVVRMPMAAIGSDKQAACGATEDPGCPVGSDRKGLTPEKVSLPSLTAPKQKSRLPHPNWVVRVPMAEIGAGKLSLLPSPVRRSPSVMSAGERDYNFLGSCLGSRAMETPNKLKTYMGVLTPDKVSLPVLTPTAPKPKRRLLPPNRLVREPMAAIGADKQAASGATDAVTAGQDQLQVRLQPLSNPEQSLTDTFEMLSSDDWEEKIDGLTTLRSLAQNHAGILKDNLYQICMAIYQEVKNLRSSVSTVAMATLGDLYAHLQKAMNSQAEETCRMLLPKAGDPHAFIREHATCALGLMVQSCSPGHVLNALLNGGLSHRNASVRESTARHIDKLAEVIGPARVLMGKKDFTSRFLNAVSKLSLDSAQEVRHHGRNTLQRLVPYPEFTKMWAKIVPRKDRESLKVIFKLIGREHLSILSCQV